MQSDRRPPPRDAAADTSAALTTLIAAEIEHRGGWIRFSRFMELALYAPGLGYYSAGAAKIGRSVTDGSDFTTAPELTPLFGRALARPVAEVLERTGGALLELGGGTGALAVDLLLELEALGRLPTRYQLLEVSADLRERQRETIATRAPHLLDRVEWLTALPETIDGAVVANEVLDALPVDLIVWDGDRWLVRGVTVEAAGFVYADRPLLDELGAAIEEAGLNGTAWAVAYQTELHGPAEALVASIASRLGPGSVAFMIDYGFPRSEYYHPQRSGGTLMTHRGHRASTDPFVDVGVSDITAHVDFSAIADAAASAGASPLGYTSQAAFLARLRHRDARARNTRRKSLVGHAGPCAADAALRGRDGRTVQGVRLRPGAAADDRLRKKRPSAHALSRPRYREAG